MAKAVKFVALAVGAVALIATGVGAVALGGLAGTLTVAGVSTSTLFLVSGALSVAAGLLQKPPEIPSSQVDRLNATVDPRAYRKTALGSTALATDIRYIEWFGKDQERCGWIVAHASHRIQSVDEIWLDDELAWTASGGTQGRFFNYFWVRRVVLEGSAANAFSFGSGKWNGSRRLTGCAYSQLEFKVTGNSKKAESPFASGIPSRVTVIGKGGMLYDPRRDSTVPGGSGPMRADDQSTWRYITSDGADIGENLALHILRVLLGWKINGKLAVGAGVPKKRINLQSFLVAANQCEELVNRSAGGTEARYRGAGVISEGDDPRTIQDLLCAACCGRFRDDGGQLSLAIMHNDLAAAATDPGLNDDDVVGGFTWDPDPSLESTPNVVRGKYTDASPQSLYQLVPYPEVSLPSFDGIDRFMPMDLAWVESPSQAQRVVKQTLQRKQYQRRFSAPFDITAWRYKVGDVVPFTFAALGFNRRLFRVAEMTPGANPCPMVLEAEDPAIYAWDADDRAPVQAAEPIVYDSRNNPLILAIDEAGTTAIWDGVTDPNGTKPDDNATNGADPDSPLGGKTVRSVLEEIEQANQDIDDLVATFGTTAAADASAAAAAIAAGNAAAARDQSQSARDAAQAAKALADAAAATAAQRAQDANGFAQTASGQATIATQKADAAGQSAGIASAKSDIATTKAGEASVSAWAAATSESNALGSKNAAASSATVSATNAKAAAQAADFPLSFAQKGALYASGTWGSPPALLDSDFISGPSGFSYSKAGNFVVAYARAIPAKRRLFRYQARIRALGANATYSADFEYSNGLTGALGGSFNGFATLTPAAGWLTIDYLIDNRGFDTLYFWPQLRGTAGAGGTVEIDYFRVIDITDQQAAADSATAAASSSQSAATSKDQAGERASAADDSRVAAQTAAGQASGFRDQAATSQQTAAGSAATATQQAGLAAQSATAAGGSATAANTSAGTASTKADAAGASASAADVSAQTAAGHRGAAESAAQAAQGSAVAADGAASSASSYVTLAAQRADAAGTFAAAAKSSADAVANAGGALATRMDGVEVKVGEANAKAGIASQAVADVKTGLAAARLELSATSPGGRASVVVRSDSSNGAGIDIVGDVRFMGKLYVGGTTGKRVQIDENRIVIDNGFVMSARGTGFGTQNQFIEWVGPSRDLALCNEADAVSYITTDGRAYFGGGLSAGILKNAVQTTAIDIGANVTTGAFGSNGRARTVTVSYFFYRNAPNTGTCPASPVVPTATVELHRGTDASGPILSTQTFTGNFQCERGFPGEPGFIGEQIAGGFTFTDTAGGTTAAYFVRLVGRSTNTSPQQQSLGVISTEQ
jgi:hypothetical protein